MSGRNGGPVREEAVKVVLGLGNPGERYARNRHNIGFRVADLLVARLGARFVREPGLGDLCWTARFREAGEEILVAKPRTYMNRSGRAASALLAGGAAEPCDLLVVHDDADLELGRMRVRRDGGAGGHNGVRSVTDALGTHEFPRIRLGVRGVGRGETDLADYVLDDFEEDETAVAESLVLLGADAAQAILADGLEAAMRRFHRSPREPAG